jgi:hypothetical protein
MLKRGQVSITITKPKMTINGFVIDKQDLVKVQSKPKVAKKSTSADRHKISTSTVK